MPPYDAGSDADPSDGELLDAELGRRRTASGENRLPPALAVLAAAVIYWLLPDRLLFAPRIIVPAIEVALLVSLIATNPHRLIRRTRWSRIVSTSLAALVVGTNLVSLGLLVAAVSEPDTPGGSLLIAGMQVWLTNVIGFGLLYWELDRGGPVARRELRRDALPPADFRFAQDEDHDAVREVAVGSSQASGWVPLFMDYLYVSLTNSSAFSPTDTMPLSTRAKALMGLQSTSALLVTLLVVSRAVGALGS